MFVQMLALPFLVIILNYRCRGQLKCDATRAETRFSLSAKRTSPFKSVGASVQSTTGSRGVRISVSNAGFTMFRGSVKGTGYPLHSPVSSLHFPSRSSPCAIRFQLESTSLLIINGRVHLNWPGGGVSSVDCWQPRCAYQR